MEFWQALAVVGTTLGVIVSLLTAFHKPIRAFLDRHDKKVADEKRLDENDTQTDQNKKSIENIQEVLKKQSEWNKKADEKFARDYNELTSLKTDMTLLKNGQLDTNRSLELISEQIGLVTCLLTGDEKAKELVEAIGREYKDKEKLRIIGGGKN